MNKFIDKIVNTFGSIKTAILLLIFIILASGIGTFIPQGLLPGGYLRRFNQPTYNLFRLLGLTDVYHSWWFIVLLILLWMSIFTCTLRRLPLHRKTFSTFITHLGLLIILAGALVTGILGERGFMLIYEKHNQDTYIDADNKFKTLDFKIYLDDFSIDYYDDAKKQARHDSSAGAGFIKDFRSKVVILKEDKEILKETIKVNRPLTYKGYSFYQASYDQDNFKWTGLEVVRDPGVPFVWCGFILLNLGVILRFYFLPADRQAAGRAKVV